MTVNKYTPAFQQWWSHYPSYKRKGKGAAFKTWEKDKLDSKVGELIEILDAQYEHDAQFKKYTPMPATYLNQNRYDDYVPLPKRALPPVPDEVIPEEEDVYVKSINRVALPWLMMRGGLPDERMPGFKKLIKSLAVDAKELHDRQELTDEYAKAIRQELNEYANRNTEVADGAPAF